MNIAGASDRVYGSYSPHSKNTNQKHNIKNKSSIFNNELQFIIIHSLKKRKTIQISLWENCLYLYCYSSKFEKGKYNDQKIRNELILAAETELNERTDIILLIKILIS